ncbi:arf-GAP with dual PH domain-containing protein 1-like isoform X1 [Lethenteron reissneri]|uniref:arf-GAP with dual PH domain-containing protein 1-like isoform X1 n=1 Tax=Lethenteron reissneri TaxID=7753 RepID=UPI002AB7C6D4|nr:arf-GAP with dual PH domain-containing protein 1-like isoform X1 [Lethenteron reissneri]
MADRERNKKSLHELLRRPGNECCADCGLPDPDWASYTLGVFICLHCSGIHRNMTEVSRVKSLRLDFWEDEQVEFMANKGNVAAKELYEQRIPPFYYRPTADDCQVLKEQWIRARYERREFIDVEKQEPYSTGYREGYLWKRGRDSSQFLRRKFILSEREGVLKYFTKSDAKEPKGELKIAEINATFQPDKIGNPNGLQVTYLKDGSTRSLFVYHEEGKVIVDWFNAIRAVRYHYLKVAYPGTVDKEITPRLTRNYVKEGYMEKTGPKQKESFRRRWFTLDAADRRLMYFKDPLDAFAKGEVFLGNGDHGYAVLEGFPPGLQGHHWAYGITIVTPERKYVLGCRTEDEQAQWITHFHRVIMRPMSPQEYSAWPRFRGNRKSLIG